MKMSAPPLEAAAAPQALILSRASKRAATIWRSCLSDLLPNINKHGAMTAPRGGGRSAATPAAADTDHANDR